MFFKNSAIFHALLAITDPSSMVMSTFVSPSGDHTSPEPNKVEKIQSDAMTSKSSLRGENRDLPMESRRSVKESVPSLDFLDDLGIKDPSVANEESSASSEEKINLSALYWVQLGPDVDGESTGDNFGYATSLSSDGMRLAVGGMENDDGGSNSGHVRVYDYDLFNETWLQVGQDIDGEAFGDGFGFDVDLSGDGSRLVVGSPYNEDGVHCTPGDDYKYGDYCYYDENAGATYVFELINNAWTQIGQDLDGTDGKQRCGYSVSISYDGETIAMGCPALFFDIAGYIKMYNYIGGLWVESGRVNGNAGARFGTATTLSGDGLTVASTETSNGWFNPNEGRAKVYRYRNGGWSKLGQDITQTNSLDGIGEGISLNYDGTTVAVSAVKHDGVYNDIGQVRVFDLGENRNWQQVGSEIEGDTAGEQVGRGLELSADGSRIVVGGPHADEGSVRVFDRTSNNQWVQIGQEIFGEAIADNFGASVSVSADGDIIAIGGYDNDSSNGLDTGHARVYKLGVSGSCTNSFLPLYLDDDSMVECYEAASLGLCDTSVEVLSHCPYSCGSCLMYQCSDSMARLSLSGATCFLVSTLPEAQIDFYCGFPEIYRTCRDTCDYCSYE